MKLVSYANYGDPDDFLHHHLPEILERNFDTVLFAVCEQTWQYNLNGVKEMRQHAESAGLDTWVGPWGLCNMFGGEAVSTYKCDDEGALFLELWKQDVANIGFKTIFLDEPRIDCDPDVVFEWFERQRMTTMPEIKLTTTLSDDLYDDMTDEHIQELPVDSLGISCYHWTHDVGKIVERTTRWTRRLVNLRPRDNHVWVQNFDLPAGTEWVPVLTKALARLEGVTDFAHWSFRGSRSVSAKACVNWKQVWDTC